MKKIILKPGREHSLRRRHPWIFSGAIARVAGEPAPGETVAVFSAQGEWLASAAYSPHSQIRARIWSFTHEEMIDADFFQAKLQQAIARRQSLLATQQSNACRLVYGESDGLPGLIVDRYADFLVCQYSFTGVEYWKAVITDCLAAAQPCLGIYERSDSSAREKEGLPIVNGLLYGQAPPALLPIFENGSRYQVDIQNGHKTGFYLDQRNNRAYLAPIAKNKTVLNCFSYTGAFAISVLHGGAQHVVNIDSSDEALQQASLHLQLNGFNQDRMQNMRGNAFDILRALHQKGQRFDMIILDPPKFAENKSQQQRAARAYKDINLQACKLLMPDGLLATFSCSGAIGMDLLQKIVADAALDAQRTLRLLSYLGQAEDHPIALPFPEAFYLKGLLCQAE